MSSQSVTKGAVRRMMELKTSTEGFDDPLLQILTVRKIPAQNENQPDRYRVILSDGDFYVQAMLSSQTTHLVTDGILDKNSIVRVKQFSSNHVSNRLIIIILDLDVVSPGSEERIGDPQNIEKSGDQSASATSHSTESNPPAPVKSEAPAARPAQHAAHTTTMPSNLPSVQVYPIESLSPYQNKWLIKARVTNKSEIKTWVNQRGEGKLFSCNFLDESGEIRATGFNDQVDRLYPLLKEGHVYYVTKARVAIAKKKFTNLANDYEITFERDTHVEECLDAPEVPEVKYNFIALDSLESAPPKSTCDVIAIVQNVGDVTEIISKASQKPVTKRELTLIDRSAYSVRMTLWGKTAQTYGTPSGQPGCAPDDHPVIAFKSVSVGDFGGRSLSMFSTSTMQVNPDIGEAHALRGWFDSEGARLDSSAFKSYTMAGLGGAGSASDGFNARERKTIQQAKDEKLGMSDKPDYFNFKGTVIFIKNDNLFYPACPKDGCNKKVTQDHEGAPWRCEKCDMSHDAPKYRYMLRANVQDHTGQIWVNGFNDSGDLMIGKTADDLAKLKNQNEDTAVNEIIERASGKTWLFNVRAKQDVYQDVPRERYTITKMSAIDFAKEGMDLAEAIKKML